MRYQMEVHQQWFGVYVRSALIFSTFINLASCQIVGRLRLLDIVHCTGHGRTGFRDAHFWRTLLLDVLLLLASLETPTELDCWL